MSVHTDTNGIRTTWSTRERWSGSSVELPNFIKWLKQHSEGEVNSYFYKKIIDGELINLTKTLKLQVDSTTRTETGKVKERGRVKGLALQIT